MNKFKKILLLNCAPLLLLSCSSKKYAPYGIKRLTQVKSQDNIDPNVFSNRSFSIKINNEEKIIQMDYNEETKDFYASNYADSHSKNADTLEKQYVVDFFNSYYFITKEKLALLFPPEFVKAEYMSRNCIIIKKYYSQYSNESDESYYKFTYGYYSGYLFLTSYKNNIPIDELDVYLNY